VRYVSPLARSQKLEEITAMDQLEAVIMNRAAINPQEMDVYIWEDADRERAKNLGVPGKLMRKPEDIDAMREARAQANAEAQAGAAVQPGVEEASKELGKKVVNG
jgi:Bacteriophage head to tail connecting protein